MKWIKKFNESRFTEFDNILNDVKDMCIDFGDLGLDYKVMVKNINSHEKVKLTEIGINPVNIKTIKITIEPIYNITKKFKIDYIYFDAGVSGYRFINFQRSFYNDPKQTIAPRYTAHAYLSMTLNDRLSLQASAMQMIINRQNITMAGAMLGIILAEQSTGPIQMLHLGTHYRSTGAIAPTVGYTVGNIDLGLSSDVNMSSKTSGSVVNRAIELTLAYNVFSGNFRRKVGRYHLPY
jgi:hypothetical protein